MSQLDNHPKLEHTSQEVSEEPAKGLSDGYRVPGHPLTTVLFVAACALIVLSTVYNYPANTATGMMIVVGIPVYFF